MVKKLASSFSSFSNGIVSHLVALGAMDVFLIKGATFTFWRYRYAKHTNFAMQSVTQQFNTTVQFGGSSNLKLGRSGDLVYYMYVVIDLPGIAAIRRTSAGNGFSCNGNSSATLDCNGYLDANSLPIRDYPTPAKAPQCLQCDDEAFFQNLGDCVGNGQLDDCCNYKVGKSTWLRDNYGGEYNSAISECNAPSDYACMEDKPWAHWTNAVGQAIIKEAQLLVAGNITDTLYSEYLFMWEELSGKAGKRLKEMIGKRDKKSQLLRDSQVAQRLYVPLPFYFTMNPGNALPLTTLTLHGVDLFIRWEDLDKLIIRSDENVTVINVDEGRQLGSQDLSAALETTYVVLDIKERDQFTLANFDQLITQVHKYEEDFKGTEVVADLKFNHPIQELIWAVRRKCAYDMNQIFNFSGLDGRDPVVDVRLLLNNSERFAGKEGKYYRLVQPYQHHSSIPKGFIYCYSFGLLPEDAQPTGQCNFSRIDNITFHVKLQEGLENEYVRLIMFARNWQVLRFENGTAGPLFAN